jgi:hypothetical protein
VVADVRKSGYQAFKLSRSSEPTGTNAGVLG